MNKKNEPYLPEINQRIRLLVDELYGGSVNRFYKMVGLPSHQVINRIFNIDSRNGNYPEASAMILTKIAANIQHLNCRWLLTGTGEPFNEKTDGSILARNT